MDTMISCHLGQKQKRVVQCDYVLIEVLKKYFLSLTGHSSVCFLSTLWRVLHLATQCTDACALLLGSRFRRYTFRSVPVRVLFLNSCAPACKFRETTKNTKHFEFIFRWRRGYFLPKNGNCRYWSTTWVIWTPRHGQRYEELNLSHNWLVSACGSGLSRPQVLFSPKHARNRACWVCPWSWDPSVCDFLV